MSEINVQLRTAVGDHKAEVGVAPEARISELLDAARSNWALSNDYEYIVSNTRLGRQLNPSETFAAAGTIAGDVLEIQQLSDAGRQTRTRTRP